MFKTLGVRTTFGGSDVASLHYTTLQYTTLQDITLHYIPVHYITLHSTPVHSTTLNYTTPRYIALHYAPLHYTTLYHITLHYTTLHYTTLHYTTLSSTTLHYLTLHYTPLHYNYNYNYTTTLHYTPLHSTTLNYTTLHYITLHYTTFRHTPLHHTTLHYTTIHWMTLHSQQPNSPIGFLFLKLPPLPCAVLLVNRDVSIAMFDASNLGNENGKMTVGEPTWHDWKRGIRAKHLRSVHSGAAVAIKFPDASNLMVSVKDNKRFARLRHDFGLVNASRHCSRENVYGKFVQTSSQMS